MTTHATQHFERRYSQNTNECQPSLQTGYNYMPSYTNPVKQTSQNVVYKSPTTYFKSATYGPNRLSSFSSYNNSNVTPQPWERELPKTPTKHVRYESQLPNQPNDWPPQSSTENNRKMEPSHVRSLSDQSNRQRQALLHDQESDLSAIDQSFTDYTSPASSVDIKDEWMEPVSPNNRRNEIRRIPQQQSRSIPRPAPMGTEPESVDFRDAIKSMRNATARYPKSRLRQELKNVKLPSVGGVKVLPTSGRYSSTEGTYEFGHNRQNAFKSVRSPPTAKYASTAHYPRSPVSHVSTVSSSHSGSSTRSFSAGEATHVRKYAPKTYYSTSGMPRSMEASWTEPSAYEKAMDYRSSNVNGYGNLHISSAVTSPTQNMKGSAFGTPYGGSKSSGQPSPSSVIEELHGRFRNAGPQNPNQRPIMNRTSIDYSGQKVKPTNLLVKEPHHQSELLLPTSNTAMNYQAPREMQAVTSHSTTRLSNAGQISRPIECFSTVNQSARGGPSFRRLQTLYGPQTAQKRFPSDNALDKTYLTEKTQCPTQQRQYYVAGNKAGTVKIQVRSRSAQASPASSPIHSPHHSNTTRFLNGGNQQYQQPQQFENNQDFDRILSKQIIVPTSCNQTRSAPRAGQPMTNSSSVFGPQNEDDEIQTLPSVREIIRQVEEMTQKNENSLPKNAQRPHPFSVSSISSVTHQSRSINREQIQTGGYPNNVGNPRSFSLSSGKNPSSINSFPASPTQQLRQGNSNGNNMFNYNSVQQPMYNSFSDLNDSSRGPITVRNNQFDFAHLATSTPYSSRKADMLSNLPHDYHKLREAFQEQSREIQRLRKDLADKEKLLESLQKDIRLYEPWR